MANFNIRRAMHKLVSNKPRFIVNPLAAVKKRNITVLGAGAWGTALAIVASRKNNVKLWARDTKHANQIRACGINKRYLPTIKLPKKLSSKVTTSYKEAADCGQMYIAVPTQTVRENLLALKPFLSEKTRLIFCSKGIERGTYKLLSQICSEILPNNPYAILSGPNLAIEVAKGKPCAATLACRNDYVAQKIISAISYESFRVYYTEDVIAPQIAGAVKNVIAVASGIATGKKFGENARAALITRGVAEIKRLVEFKGGDAETITGLSGIGDLMLTCSSMESRNTRLGFYLSQGKNVNEACQEINGVTEAIPSSHSIYNLCQEAGIEMPISEAVYKIIHEEEDVDKTIKSLLRRPIKI